MSDATFLLAGKSTVLSLLLIASLLPEGSALGLACLLLTLPAVGALAHRMWRSSPMDLDHDWTACDPEPATRVDRCSRCGCTRYAIEACVSPPENESAIVTRVPVLTQYVLPGSATRLLLEPPCVGGTPMRVTPPRRKAPAARALAVA